MSISPRHWLGLIADSILDESCSQQQLEKALDEFAHLCSEASGIKPDPGFDAWAQDSFLDQGVAINPQAAAFCIKDYQRSTMFIRGLYAAINSAQQRFSGAPIKLLYAGCGPFATQLLPLLTRFQGGELQVQLIDIHQQSLDSVSQLLKHFELRHHGIELTRADACSYQHPSALHIIIAETMQKSLEQEPQFAVTAQLAPQLCARGIFIPQQIDVELCLAHWQDEQQAWERGEAIEPQVLEAAGLRYPLASLFTLLPGQAASQLQSARHNTLSDKMEIAGGLIEIPAIAKLQDFDPLLLTRIRVFEDYRLDDYQAEISLPYRVPELMPLSGGAVYECCYELGTYPRFNFQRIND